MLDIYLSYKFPTLRSWETKQRETACALVNRCILLVDCEVLRTVVTVQVWSLQDRHHRAAVEETMMCLKIWSSYTRTGIAAHWRSW